MTRTLGGVRLRRCGRRGMAAIAGAALALAGWGAPVSPASAAGPSPEFAPSHLDLPSAPPGQEAAARPADGAPLYERAPVPDQDAFEPRYDSGPSDPVQPSVISRASKATQGDGYSRNSSANSAQESRMRPGLGFALHVPTE